MENYILQHRYVNMHTAETYSEPSPISKIERFAKIVNSHQLFSQNAPSQMFDMDLNTPLYLCTAILIQSPMDTSNWVLRERLFDRDGGQF